MDVFVVERVFDVAVQIANVRTGFDGEFLVNVFGPDELAPLLPVYVINKK